MTDKLPPQLLALFAARPPLKYKEPIDHAIEDRKTAKITGVGAYLSHLNDEFGDYHPTESPLERKDRKQLAAKEKQRKLIEDDFHEQYKPKEDKNVRGTGFETLFISRLSYNTTVDDLKSHFRKYGPIDRVRIIVGSGVDDKKHKNKPRGYAFVQFEKEDDMKKAYKDSEHLVLHGRRVVVDVERGRTVRGWRPRRFGGGLGGRHYTAAQKAQIGRPFNGPPSGPGFRGGGFRGGFRGGRGGGGFGDRGGFRGGRFGGAPSDAPSGPRSGGYGSRDGGSGGYGRDRRGGGGGGGPNANYEPVQPRGSYRERESGRYDGGRNDGGRSDDRRGPRY